MSISIQSWFIIAISGALCALAAGCSADAGSVPAAGDEANTAQVSQAISMGPVDVIEATYGANCGVPRSNATWSVVQQCDGTSNCLYKIQTGTLGDPKRGCDKNFDVRYSCGTNGTYSQHVNGEANGQQITLACQTVQSTHGAISVKDATFGGNYGQPTGNVTWDVAPACDGVGMCKYYITTAFLGDPARGKDKDFMVHYKCSNTGATMWNQPVSPEASGKTITLLCP